MLKTQSHQFRSGGFLTNDQNQDLLSSQIFEFKKAIKHIYLFLILESEQKQDFSPLSQDIFTQIKTSYDQDLSLKDLQQLLVDIKNNSTDIGVSIAILEIENSNKPQIKLIGMPGFEAWLYRQQQLAKLPLNQTGLTGSIRAGDSLIVGSSFLFQAWIDQQKNLDLWQDFDKLSKLIDDKIAHNPLALGIVFAWKKEKFKFVNLKTKVSSKLPSLNLKLSSRRSGLVSKKRRWALLGAGVFLLLLLISVGLGLQKRHQYQQQQAETELIEAVTYRLDQAKSLQNLNPNRAKTLLNEARQTLDEYQQDQDLPINIQNLETQLVQAYSQVARQHQIREPEIFYDLALFKENFKPDQISLSEDELLLLDDNSQVLAILNIKTKAFEVLAGKDVVLAKAQLASIPAWVFLASNNKIQIIDKQNGKQLNSFKLSTIQPDILIGYSNNAYILDKSSGQLWRFKGIKDSLSKPEAFFADEQELADVADIAIDGSLWLLDQSGGVAKYTTGVKDAYYPGLGLDIPLNSPQSLFTDENSQNLYVLDQNNQRVVVASKNGEYQGQYLWDQLNQVSELVVSEELGKILVVVDDKIYEIALQ